MEIKMIYSNGHEDENYFIKYHPMRRWIYKSAMDPEDFVLFKWSVRVWLNV